jgi:hypothetical protein
MTSPSSTNKPDLDWSQIRETVLMLNLAVAQIEHAMKEGDDSVNTLTNSFTSMIGHAQVIRSAAENLADGAEKDTVMENCEAISTRMQSAVMAFQFYDKMTQRVTHVSNSLAALGELINHPTHLYNPYEWKGLQEKIKSKYTIESDRKMFEAILNGATVDEALKQAQQAQRDNGDDESVELF